MTKVNIRKGEKKDLPSALSLIKELAIYEKAPDEVRCSVQSMEEDGFGENKIFEFFVAEVDNKVVGLALYYYKYSTWKGRCLYLEDLIVSENFRRHGIGSLLFDKVVDVANKLNLRRMEWQVLNWNESAIAFYKKHQAILDDEWVNVKFEWQRDS